MCISKQVSWDSINGSELFSYAKILLNRYEENDLAPGILYPMAFSFHDDLYINV